MNKNFSTLFLPKSVAVIGASPDKQKIGWALLNNLATKKSLKIYPINPKYKKIEQWKCFGQISELPKSPDLALIAIKSEFVPAVLEECGKKQIPSAIIISSGFKEAGERGTELEKQLSKIATKYKINLLGPNCLGFVNVIDGINASFAFSAPAKGGIAFLSQSGALGTAFLDWAIQENIGLSQFISLGNKAVLDENDFLEYLGEDRSTKAILMYLEGFTDGARFKKIIAKISSKKPVVILKTGRTAKGAAAVVSHTGSLVNEEKVVQAICRETNVILVDSIEQLFNISKIFNAGIFFAPQKIAIITNGGGPSVVLSDAIELSSRLELAKISFVIQEKLKKILPANSSLQNPIDLLGDALSDRFVQAMKIIIQEKNIDAVFVLVTPQMMTEIKKTSEAISNFFSKKPIFPIFIGGQALIPALNFFRAKHIPYFLFPQEAVDVLEKMSFAKKKTVALKAPGLAQTKFLETEEVLRLLQKYQIRHSPYYFWRENSFLENKKLPAPPWAMKLISPDIIHKTEAKAIFLNLARAKELQKVRLEMISSVQKFYPRAKIAGFLIQPMETGREVIIGMKQDATFGPMVTFGLGGIFVEVLGDIAMRSAPLFKKEALRMIKEIKGYKILSGARGGTPINFEALADILVKISFLAIEHPEIQEIDFNPVMVDGKQAIVVDARMAVRDLS